MPTDAEKLSERLLELRSRWGMDYEFGCDDADLIAGAAAYIAERERAEAQPEVAELRRLVVDLHDWKTCSPEWIDQRIRDADALLNHCAFVVANFALVESERDEARAKLERVEGLPEKWRPSLYEQGVVSKDQFADSIRGVERRARERCADELAAALRGTDSQRPGNSAFHRPLTGTEEARESPWLVRGDALRGEGGDQ